ncbi:MAG: hypothetical protein DHS20C21_06810 [Gemmatimonadota bacterium]|nr:MAG: hypothetical protein DHS20C21_06810 [Gemmatimonadota bacterium]
MRELWLSVRSTFFWTLSGLHFLIFCPLLILLGRVLSKQATDPFLRFFSRNLIRLTGARYEVRRSPGSRVDRPCLLMANHVNIFDPFVIYPATEGVTRGLELESHFQVPIYGWLMESFGNVPVPDRPDRKGLDRMRRKTSEALTAGTSLIVFPEGTRTRSGRLGTFRTGVFRLAVDLQVRIVPVTVVGSFELKRVNRARLSPSTIVIHLHDAIEPGDDPVALRNRVREIVNGPLEAREAGSLETADSV